jgi:hypothetical protein
MVDFAFSESKWLAVGLLGELVMPDRGDIDGLNGLLLL